MPKLIVKQTFEQGVPKQKNLGPKFKLLEGETYGGFKLPRGAVIEVEKHEEEDHLTLLLGGEKLAVHPMVIAKVLALGYAELVD